MQLARGALGGMRVVRHHDDGLLEFAVEPIEKDEDLLRGAAIQISRRLVREKQRRDHVMTALGIVGLADRNDHYPRQLSGGQEQRVAIARAIVTDPTLLLADEPTGDLDAKSAGEVLTLLQRQNEEFKKTIIMVTHDPHAAERASHLLHLEKGTLVEQIVLARS